MDARHRMKGFTLLELIVVIAMIAAVALVAGMLLPARSRATSRYWWCKSNMKQIGLAIGMYTNDFGGSNPTRGLNLTVGTDDLRALGSLSLLYDQYITAREIFRCPKTRDDPCSGRVGLNIDPAIGLITARPAGCSYAYDSQKGPLTPPEAAIASDKPYPPNRLLNSPNHQNVGQNVLYFDGHVNWSPTPRAGWNNDHIWFCQDETAPLSYSDSYVTQ